MTLKDYLASLIRTYVPVGVGALVAWLATRGVDVDYETATALATGLTGFIAAVYYALLRAIETQWPRVGALLGIAQSPTYRKNPPAEDTADTTPLA